MNTIHRPVLKNSERKLNSELLKAILLNYEIPKQY